MEWTVIYILDILALTIFLISYYRNCYRRGYRIDFWHLQLFLVCVLPNMIMIPFARNELNQVVLGRDFYAVVAVLPTIYLITLLGFFAMLLGGSMWRLRLDLGLRAGAARVLDILPRCSMMLMSSRILLVFQSALCIFLQVIILGVYFAGNGFGFDLRAYTFAHPVLRPFAQTVAMYSAFIASHALARYIDTRERILVGCTLAITLGLVFFGSRGILISIYLGILVCYLIRLRSRAKLIQIGLLFTALVMTVFYLGNARAGNYSISDFFASIAFLLFFGNNFSDLRDFAWVYSAWNHHFWLGKTYLAAIAAFVPRFASQFRDTWGMGAATAATVGFDPHVHPGVRPGSFGEGYLNFGLCGVIVVGLLIGIISRRADFEVKRSFAPDQDSMMRAAAYTMLITIAGTVAISVNMSGLYVYLGIYLFSWVCLLVMRAIQPEWFPPTPGNR